MSQGDSKKEKGKREEWEREEQQRDPAMLLILEWSHALHSLLFGDSLSSPVYIQDSTLMNIFITENRTGFYRMVFNKAVDEANIKQISKYVLYQNERKQPFKR